MKQSSRLPKPLRISGQKKKWILKACFGLSVNNQGKLNFTKAKAQGLFDV
jgi:hypothetical protein